MFCVYENIEEGCSCTIWGLGGSPEEARSDARRAIKNYTGANPPSIDLLITQKCTDNFAQWVEDNNNAEEVSYEVNDSGEICIPVEDLLSQLIYTAERFNDSKEKADQLVALALEIQSRVKE